MRILYTLPDLHFGGSSNLLLQNIANLAMQHEVFLIYFGPNEEMWTSFKKRGITPIRISYNGRGDLYSTIIETKKFIRENGIELIHTNLFLDKLIITLSTIGNKKIKKVSTIHSADDNQANRYFKNNITNKIENLLNKYFMHKIIAVSQAAFTFSVKNRNIPASKMEVIFNGITPLKTDISKLSYNSSSDTLILGTACRFHSIKGLPRLLEVISKLKESGCSLKLFLIGDGGQRPLLEGMIEKLNLKNEVEITGFTENVEKYISKLHYYVNSSYSEGLPISVLEALSLGKPIIASDVGGLKEIVFDNYNGVRVDFNNVEETVSMILDLINLKENSYELLCKNAKECFNKQFSSEVYIRNLNRLYESL